jgi:hypothetical protein
MANTNTLSTVIPQLLAQGLQALRQMAIMPRFVNRAYESIAGEKGSTIDINIPSAIVAQAVTPSYLPPDDAGVVPTKISMALDQWWEAPFFLNDKEMLEVMAGTIPMQASEAIKAIANNVDSAILALYKQLYGFVGVPGTTPFAVDPSEWLDADQVLNDQLCPTDNRFVAINSKAKANALALRAFQDAAWRGDNAGIVKGDIGEKLGAYWFMDQNIPRHTAGTVAVSFVCKAATAQAIGTTSLVTTTGGNAALLAGDILTIAGDEQTYLVTANASRTGGGDLTVVISPGLKIAVAGAEVISIKDSHRVNLAFHRDCFALASRPFAAADPMGLGTFMSAVDPVSGLALRLEVSRQHKRTRFSYDILYGVKCVRPELGCRIAGE